MRSENHTPGSSAVPARVTLTSHVLSAWRALRLGVHLLTGVTVAATVYPRVRPTRQDRILKWWAGGLLRALGVRVRTNGQVPPHEARDLLLVANHVSWLDVFAVHAVKPVRFVAKAEIRAWPVLGWLTAQTGTVFIERERRRHTVQVIDIMRGAWAQHVCVGVFPEGTSSMGDHVKAFRPALFEAAAQHGAVIQPVAIRYVDGADAPSRAAAYAEDINFMQCLTSILREPRLVVELNFAPSASAEGQSRQQLARATEHTIARMLNVPVRSRQPETSGDLPAG